MDRYNRRNAITSSIVEIRGRMSRRKALARFGFAIRKKQEVLMILVEAGNDVALNVLLRRRVEDGFRWRARHVLADERRQNRDVDRP